MDILIKDVEIYHSIDPKYRDNILEINKKFYYKYDGLVELFIKLSEKKIKELSYAIKNKIDSGYEYKKIFKLPFPKSNKILTKFNSKFI